MTTRIIILIGTLLFLLSCQKEQKKDKPIVVTEKKSDTLEREKEVSNDIPQTLSTPLYKNVLLISGGSPSISAKLTMANLYSSRVQKFMDKNYKVLNTAIAQEPNPQLIKRLPRLFEHEVAVFVLEIGADEEKAALSKKRFTEKLNTIFQVIEQQMPSPQIIIIPSTSKKVYLDGIRQISYPKLAIQILQPAEFSPYTAEWHEYVARQLSKMVE